MIGMSVDMYLHTSQDKKLGVESFHQEEAASSHQASRVGMQVGWYWSYYWMVGRNCFSAQQGVCMCGERSMIQTAKVRKSQNRIGRERG